MKRILTAALMLVSVTGFAQEDEKIKVTPRLAKVNQMQGIYIFTDSEPVAEYDYIGTVKAVMSWSGQYQELREKLIWKTKKEHPSANGLILHLKDGSVDRADAIKFKD